MIWDDIKIGDFLVIKNPKNIKKNRLYLVQVQSSFYDVHKTVKFVAEDTTVDIYRNDVMTREIVHADKKDYPEVFL